MFFFPPTLLSNILCQISLSWPLTVSQAEPTVCSHLNIKISRPGQLKVSDLMSNLAFITSIPKHWSKRPEGCGLGPGLISSFIPSKKREWRGDTEMGTRPPVLIRDPCAPPPFPALCFKVGRCGYFSPMEQKKKWGVFWPGQLEPRVPSPLTLSSLAMWLKTNDSALMGQNWANSTLGLWAAARREMAHSLCQTVAWKGLHVCPAKPTPCSTYLSSWCHLSRSLVSAKLDWEVR